MSALERRLEQEPRLQKLIKGVFKDEVKTRPEFPIIAGERERAFIITLPPVLAAATSVVYIVPRERPLTNGGRW